MNQLLKTAVGGAILCMMVSAQQPPKLRLPDSVAPSSYKAALTLDPAKDSFDGTIEIKVDIKRPTSILWLNQTKLRFSDAAFKMNGKTLRPKILEGGDDFVGLQFDSEMPVGKAEISIAYTGGLRTHDSSGAFRMVDNGNQYIYTQFESTDARAVFPCFDEPAYKVRWQLTLTIPSADTALSNTAIKKQEKKGEQTTYVFEETKPLPSYLIAFGVGPFDYVDAGTAGRNHIPVRIVTPKGHAEEAKYAAEITANVIARLEDYFGTSFPYSKLDQVAIPATFGFTAQENAGMVTYSQNVILAKPAVDTTVRQREFARDAAHELAHQWFGDLVTMAWWDDIWLNEAFATWMEYKILREWKPEWHTDVNDIDSKAYAQRLDSLMTARKIRQEIITKDDISNAFDGITYQKGAAVIGMFENYVGPEIFRKGVQSYLKQYSFRKATAPEFLDSISSASKKNVTESFSTFLNQAGVPLVSVALDCSRGAPTLHLEQQRFVPVGTKAPEGAKWQIPMCVRYGSGLRGETGCEVMMTPKQDWTLNTSVCPTWIEANDKGVGYYRTIYQSSLLSGLVSGDVQHRLGAPERVDFMGNMAVLAEAGKVPEAAALGLVETFASDPARQVVQNALDLALQPEMLHAVPEDLIPQYQRFIQKNFQARARQVGWVAKAGEDDDITLLRPNLLRLVSTWGNDQDLASQAKTLAEKWLADHSSVDPNIVVSVLETAAFSGDKAFFEKLEANLETTKDRQERGWIISAMRGFRDPAAIQAGFNFLLSGKVPFIEGGGLLFGGRESDSTRKLSFDFVRVHYDEILEKRPTGSGFDFGSVLPAVGASYCDEESKTELKVFF